MKIILPIFVFLSIFVFGKIEVVPEMEVNKEKMLIINLKPAHKKYYVKSGDTIKSIAKKFNVSEEEIKDKNNIKNDKELREREYVYISINSRSI